MGSKRKLRWCNACGRVVRRGDSLQRGRVIMSEWRGFPTIRISGQAPDVDGKAIELCSIPPSSG